MKVFKKISALLLTGILFFSVACGGESSQSSSSVENTGDKVELWSTYGTVKVMQNRRDEGRYTKLPAELSVSMMKNETEGAQLIMTANQDVNGYTITPSALTDGKGNTIPVEDIVLYNQKYQLIEKVYPHIGGGANDNYIVGDSIPDMLLPTEISKKYGENTIQKNTNQGITMEVTTHSDTVPGEYSGTFELNVDGQKTDIPVRVNVWDIEYTGRKEYQSSFLIYRWQLLNGEYSDSDEVVKAYTDFMLDYNICTYWIKSPWTETEIVDEAIRLWNYSESFNSIIIPAGLGRDGSCLNSSGAVSGSAQTIINFIKAIAKASTEEMPLIDYAYLYLSDIDEADALNIKSIAERLVCEDGEYDQVLDQAIMQLEAEGWFSSLDSETAEHFRSSIENMPLVFTNVYFNPEWVGELDCTFCPYLSMFNDGSQIQRYKAGAQEDANGNLWTYTCTGPKYPNPTLHIDDYALGSRVAGWMSKDYGINGYLYWSAAYYNGRLTYKDDYIDVYGDASRENGSNGDSYLVYPGKYYGSEKPFPTNRLIAYRDSVDDYCMLSVLERELNAYAEKYAITEGIDVNDYVRDIYDSLYTGSQYYTDDALLYQAREELARRILALRNEDDLIAISERSASGVDTVIYTSLSTLTINGEDKNGVEQGEGYVYTVSQNLQEAKDVTISSENGEYVVSVKSGVAITDFVNSIEGVTVSEDSTIVASGTKATVTIKSVAKGKDNTIDGATRRFRPEIRFTCSNATDVDAICFRIKNLGNVEIIGKVELVYSTGTITTIDTFWCDTGATEDIRLHIRNDIKADYTNLESIRITFDNITTSEDGETVLIADRVFEISDVWYDKR